MMHHQLPLRHSARRSVFPVQTGALLAIFALVSLAGGDARADVPGYTFFDEPVAGQDPTPNDGDHNYVSQGGELGFATIFSETQGPGSIHTLGVYQSPDAPRVFRIRTVESETHFDTVDLSTATGVLLTFTLRISETSWEPGDYFRAVIDDGAGTQVSIVDFSDVELNVIPSDTDLLIQYEIPDAWNEANLVISGFTNSSADSEILDFDAIEIRTTFVPPGAEWRYLDDGSDQGTAWTAAAFPDGTWAAGPAQLGYGDGDEATVIGSGPPLNHFITSYFRHHFPANGPEQLVALTGLLLRDDGAIVYLNGAEVFRSNMPPGVVDHQRRASEKIAGGGEVAYQSFKLDPALLLVGDNVLAVEIHQQSPSSSDVSFELLLSPSLVASSPALVRAPYLQIGTPTSIIVRWRTNTPTASELHWGAAPGSLLDVVSVPGYRREHEIPISGLSPATRYYYSVGTDAEVLAGDDFDHWFDTSPVPGSNAPTRIWVIGDSGECGFSEQGCQDAAAVRDAYLNFAGNDRADVFMLLGDNAYLTGTDANYTKGFFEVYPTVMRNSVIWPAPGNHEFYSFGSSPLQQGAYYDAFTMPTQAEAGGLPSGTEAYYAFDYGNLHFITLDSHDTDRSAPADPIGDVCAPNQGGAMYQWLCADLASTDKDFVIVFWHHPPYTKGSHDSDDCSDEDIRICDMRERFLPVIEDFGVDLQLTGHSHSYERSKLIDGHYGQSASFDPLLHVVQPGNGDPNSDGPYYKPNLGLDPHAGAVYSVVGSSSKNEGDLSLHPAMAVAINYEGSMVIDVEAGTLDGYFIDKDDITADHFRIIKGQPPSLDLAINGDSGAFVFPTAPVQLTLDMTSAGVTETMSWFWLASLDGNTFWITEQGLSLDPAPLVVLPPVDLDDLILLNNPGFQSGSIFWTAVFLFDGNEIIAIDTIGALWP